MNGRWRKENKRTEMPDGASSTGLERNRNEVARAQLINEEWRLVPGTHKRFVKVATLEGLVSEAAFTRARPYRFADDQSLES